MENSTNSTLGCHDGVPSFVEFIDGFHLIHALFLTIPVTLCIMTLFVYVINLRNTMERGHKDTKGNVAALLTIYPVSCITKPSRLESHLNLIFNL